LSSLLPLEIQALVKILDELDYYQILHLEPDAAQSDVKKAYFTTSRSFHPDANRHLDAAMRSACMRVSKRVTEAYCVLRDPRRRSAYNARRQSDDGNKRIQLAEARASHVTRDREERQGKTAQGRQFYQKAVQCKQRGDTAGTVNNLQMALTLEPGNAFFKQQLAAAKTPGAV
jgi:DnaJ-class molecular chaperone